MGPTDENKPQTDRDRERTLLAGVLALSKLCKLQQKLINILTPYALKGGFDDELLLIEITFQANKALDEYKYMNLNKGKVTRN